MYTFALQKLSEIEGKLSFYKLVVNGDCEFDAFCAQCENDGNLASEIRTIQARMQQLSDLKTIPKEKHKDITLRNESVKEYEIKTKHLRVYMFHEKDTGRIIVIGGKKTTQKQDITRFRNIKKSYLESRR